MRKATGTALAICCLFSTGCANAPDVGVRYFHPRLDARLKVLETVSCDANDNVIAAASASPTTVYSASADLAEPLNVKAIGSLFADTGLTFTFHEDGRLKTVNSASTGKGEVILKSAVKLIGTLAAPGSFALSMTKGTAPSRFKTECDKIRELGKGQPISLTFESGLPLDHAFSARAGIEIEPDRSASPYFDEIKRAVGTVCALLDPPVGGKVGQGMTTIASKDRDNAMLELVQPAIVTVTAYVAKSGNCQEATGRNVFWKAALRVPQLGKPYYVPIPPAAMFGKQTFALELSDSGTITKLQYDKETGADEAMNVANDAADQFTTDTKEETERMKDERARIAEQERLVQCLADRSKCGS